MSEVDLKRKYLRRAHHLIQRDDHSTKRKLRASVEPLSGARGKIGAEREGNESCSESDSLSRKSSSSQIAALESHVPKLPELKSLPNTPVRVGPTTFHHLRAPLSSMSMPTPRQAHSTTPSSTCPRSNTTAVSRKELESQLQTQWEVNRELKRLLVASVGSDLEHRLEQIVQEKAELSLDLSVSLQQVVSNHEELDQVSIECDIWRSKFIASRVMIDELASWKAELSLQLRESHKALQYMLHERKDICQELQECSGHLQRALIEVERFRHRALTNLLTSATNIAAVSPVQYSTQGTSLVDNCVSTTVLDLAHSNTFTTQDLASQLCRVATGKPNEESWHKSDTSSPQLVIEPTTGERLAQRAINYKDSTQRSKRETTPPLPKLLLTDDDLVHHRPSMAASGGSVGSSSLSPLSRRLFHFGARALEDPFRLPFHCAKCQGKIIVI